MQVQFTTSGEDQVLVDFGDGSAIITSWPLPDPMPPLKPEQAAALAAFNGEPEPAPTPPRIITYSEFEDRFTDTEADAIAALSLQNATIHRVVTRAAASNRIDLDSEQMALFMGALVQAGIITEARGAEILGE